MIPTFYTMVLAAILWLVLLYAASRARVRGCSRRVNLALGIAAVLLLFVPVGSVRLWSWFFSFCPNPSLPMLGMVCAGIWQRLFGLEVLKPADWRATWIFGAVTGSALYLHPMFVGSLDLYYWGWEHELAAGSLAVLAAAFLATGNRLGVLLLAALIAYACRALESANCWDYVVDPFYWMIGVVVVTRRAVGALVSRWRLRRTGEAPPAFKGAAVLPKPAA